MVTRVWGKADNFEVVLTQNNGLWNVNVPTDLSDGQYVIELTALGDNGIISYYTCILSMVNGGLIGYRILPSDKKVSILDEKYYVLQNQTQYYFNLGEQNYKSRLLSECNFNIRSG